MKKINNKLLAGILCISLAIVVSYMILNSIGDEQQVDKQATTTNGHVDANTQLSNIAAMPELGEYAELVLPQTSNYGNRTLADIASLLPYHNYVEVDEVVNTLNTMVDRIDEGRLTMYDVYSSQDQDADPSKEDAALFYFHGEANAPFAIVNAGGGFSYVGSLHESYPHAIELSNQGYNVFVLNYRTGNANVAMEDLANAIDYIFTNAEALEIDTNNYSLWGGSAGARMAAYLGSYGTGEFIDQEYPQPAAVIMQYTGYSDYTANDPPTFAIVGTNDNIASPRVMEQRIEQLENLDIPVEFQLVEGVSHGFGLGIGTNAEGWIEDALAFWKKFIN